MSQAPAIFLQHSISAGVIDELGRQASSGELIHRKAIKKASVERYRT